MRKLQNNNKNNNKLINFIKKKLNNKNLNNKLALIQSIL